MFSRMFMKPFLFLIATSSCTHLTLLRVWVREDIALYSNDARQYSEWKTVYRIYLEARERLSLPQSYFKDGTRRDVSHTALVAAPGIDPECLNSSHLFELATSRGRTEETRNTTPETVSCLAAMEQRLRPCQKGSVSQPSDLFAQCLCKRVIKRNDAQQGDLPWRIYYISGRWGEEEKGRKRERRKRFLAFQQRSQRHLAVISAKVHQASDRVRLTEKKSKERSEGYNCFLSICWQKFPEGKTQNRNTWQEIGCYPETRLAELYTSFLILWEEMKISVHFCFLFFPLKTIISWSWNWIGLSHNISNYNAWGRGFMNEMVGVLEFRVEPGFMENLSICNQLQCCTSQDKTQSWFALCFLPSCFIYTFPNHMS